MAARLSSWFVRPGLMGGIFADLLLVFGLLRVPLLPACVKIVPVLAVLYVISPSDVIADVLPLLGQIDDLGLLVVAVKMFLKLAPAPAAAFHTAAIASGKRYAPMAPVD